MMKAGFVVVGACLLIGLTAGGCGSSGSSHPSKQELEAAKREGEEAAREKARINHLQHQVHNLQHEMRQQGHTVVVGGDSETATDESAVNGSSVLRAFHAPSGNVSCEILTNGALCSVASIDETFSFSDGEEAHIDPGAVLARGSGELAPYGSGVSAGSVSCSIPQSNEPRGITCSDGESGHGFEASRIPDRQHAY